MVRPPRDIVRARKLQKQIDHEIDRAHGELEVKQEAEFQAEAVAFWVEHHKDEEVFVTEAIRYWICVHHSLPMEQQATEINEEAINLGREIKDLTAALATFTRDEEDAKVRYETMAKRTIKAKRNEDDARDTWLTKKQERMDFEQKILWDEKTMMKLEKQFNTAVHLHTEQTTQQPKTEPNTD